MKAWIHAECAKNLNIDASHLFIKKEKKSVSVYLSNNYDDDEWYACVYAYMKICDFAHNFLDANAPQFLWMMMIDHTLWSLSQIERKKKQYECLFNWVECNFDWKKSQNEKRNSRRSNI